MKEYDLQGFSKMLARTFGARGKFVLFRFNRMNQGYEDVDVLAGPIEEFVATYDHLESNIYCKTVKFYRGDDKDDSILLFKDVICFEVYEPGVDTVNFSVVCDNMGEKERFFMTAKA